MDNGLIKSFAEIRQTERAEKGLVCEGLIFRGYSSTYSNEDGVCRKEGVKLLKRKSCKGGEDCKSWDGEDILLLLATTGF